MECGSEPFDAYQTLSEWYDVGIPGVCSEGNSVSHIASLSCLENLMQIRVDVPGFGFVRPKRYRFSDSRLDACLFVSVVEIFETFRNLKQ